MRGKLGYNFAFYPLVVMEDGRVDFGYACDQANIARYGATDIREKLPEANVRFKLEEDDEMSFYQIYDVWPLS